MAITSPAELARAGADLPAWSATLRRAEAGFSRLAAAAFGLRAVTRRDHAPYLADLALYEQAEKERAARLSDVRLGLDIGDGAGDRGRLAASFGNALSRLGLTAAPQGCPPGGASRARIAARVGALSAGRGALSDLQHGLLAAGSGPGRPRGTLYLRGWVVAPEVALLRGLPPPTRKETGNQRQTV
jgi:hypothetical protein